MKFSDLLRDTRLEIGAATMTITEDWLQGRSAFGGVQAVLAVQAMRTLVPAEVPLRTLQMTFVAPVPAGEARATARVLRAGKNAVQVEARLLDGENALACVVAVFGTARASAISRLPQQAPIDDAPSRAFPYISGLTPNFIQHFNARWRSGGVPFSATPQPTVVVDIDFLDPGPASELHVLALADFIPPVALSMLATPVPGSSLTWMLQFLVDRYVQLPLQNWRIDAEMLAAGDGYTSQSTTIWSPTGQAVALSQQSMVVFG